MYDCLHGDFQPRDGVFNQNKIYLYRLDFNDTLNGNLIYVMSEVDSLENRGSSSIQYFFNNNLERSYFLMQGGELINDNFLNPLFGLSFGKYKIELLGFVSKINDCQVCVNDGYINIYHFYNLLMNSKIK